MQVNVTLNDNIQINKKTESTLLTFIMPNIHITISKDAQ